VYGYDYAEIGRILGTSTGNVGSILTRAHARLREALAATEASADSSRAVSPRSLP
jgi:DNA-directed RNA polymerase specialized sigma24 family protein